MASTTPAPQVISPSPGSPYFRYLPVPPPQTVAPAYSGASGFGGEGTLSAGSGGGASVVNVTSVAFIPPVNAPSVLGMPIALTPSQPGNWLFACMSWDSLGIGHIPDVTVADDAHNWWEPLAPTGQAVSSSTGFTRSAIWMCPAFRLGPLSTSGNNTLNLMVEPTAAVQGLAVTVYEITGMQPWVQTGAVNNSANGASGLTTPLGAPGAQAIVFSTLGLDNTAASVSLAGIGWSSPVSTSAGSGTGISNYSTYQLTSLSTVSSWTVSPASDLSVVQGYAILAATQPASAGVPGWPAIICEAASGSGQQTPPSQLTWQTINPGPLNFDFTQGKQYETGQLSTGEGTMLFDNPAESFLPLTGSLNLDDGTPIRLRAIWSGTPWQVQFHGDGVTGSPYVFNGFDAFTGLTAGLTYSTSAWVASSQPWVQGIRVGIRFRNSGGSDVGDVYSSTFSGNVAQLATVTGAAPAGTTQADIIIEALGTPPNSIFFQAAAGPIIPGNYITFPSNVVWQTQDGATSTTLAPWKNQGLGAPQVSPWNIPFSGFFEHIPQTWDPDSLRGQSEVQVTDAWFGANYQPQPIMVDELVDDVPYALWPCTDLAGSTQASNIAPIAQSSLPAGGLPLTVTQSKYGPGSGNSFGQNQTGMLGAQSTAVINSTFRLTSNSGMWGLNVPTLNPPALTGWSLVCTDPNFPSITNGVTVECWFQPTAPFLSSASPQGAIVCSMQNIAGNCLFLGFDQPGGSQPGQLFLLDVGGNTYTIGSTNYQTGTPGLTHAVISFNRTNYTVFINGVNTAAGTFVTALPTNFTTFSMNGICGTPMMSNGQLASAYNFSGFVGFGVIYSSRLPAGRIITHYNAGINAMSGEPSYYRMERLLNIGNLTGRRLIQRDNGPVTTTNVVSCQDVPGQPVSTSLTNLAQSLLPGLFYIAPTGDIVYAARQNAWNLPVKWTLGDNFSGGETPFLGDLVIEYDLARVVNEIQITQLDDGVIVTPSIVSIEAASQIQYGTITNTVTGYLQNDTTSPYTAGPGLIDQANWQAGTQAKPHLRIDAITVDAAVNAYAWPFVLQAAVGDQVVMNRRPPGEPVITIYGRITQTEREFEFTEEAVTGKITCLIDFAPEQNALTADDAVRGQLNGTNIISW